MISVLEDVSIFLTNLDVDGPVLLDLVEVDGTVTPVSHTSTQCMDFVKVFNISQSVMAKPQQQLISDGKASVAHNPGWPFPSSTQHVWQNPSGN